MRYLLGVDIGTSGTKSVLFDEIGTVVAHATVEYPMYQPKAGWAEQDPEDWWRAASESISAVIAKSGIDAAEIAGVGLSGQMHSLVCLDGDGKVLRKAILWCDQRTAAEAAELTEIVGRERLVEITANPAMTGFTAAKLLWVRNHEPEIYEKTRKILLPKDYIRLRLTGEYATEVSDASGMQLLDVAKRTWSQPLLDTLKIDRSLLADVYESVYVSGKVTAEAAKLTGLCPGTPVVGGAGDQAAGGVGNGIVRTGTVSATLGTSGVVFAHTDEMVLDQEGRVHTLCHAVPGCWHVMGVTQAAGLSLKWFREQFCKAEEAAADLYGEDVYVLLDRLAADVPAGCDGLFYLPYLMGERTPHLDPNARGVFFGLNARHTKADLLRAVMEGVGYSMKDCLEILKKMGVPVDEVRASGGGGKSALWRQMLADMFAKKVTTINVSEGPALGVAILAGTAAGIYGSVAEGCDAIISRKTTQRAQAEAKQLYKTHYPVYKSLYRSLKHEFAKLNAISQ